MTPADALRDIRGYARAGRVRFSGHARDRMNERGATEQDVITACAYATKCSRGDRPRRWRVEGPDLDGDALSVVAVIEGGVVVITVF